MKFLWEPKIAYPVLAGQAYVEQFSTSPCLMWLLGALLWTSWREHELIWWVLRQTGCNTSAQSKSLWAPAKNYENHISGLIRINQVGEQYLYHISTLREVVQERDRSAPAIYVAQKQTFIGAISRLCPYCTFFHSSSRCIVLKQRGLQLKEAPVWVLRCIPTLGYTRRFPLWISSFHVPSAAHRLLACLYSYTAAELKDRVAQKNANYPQLMRPRTVTAQIRCHPYNVLSYEAPLFWHYDHWTLSSVYQLTLTSQDARSPYLVRSWCVKRLCGRLRVNPYKLGYTLNDRFTAHACRNTTVAINGWENRIEHLWFLQDASPLFCSRMVCFRNWEDNGVRMWLLSTPSLPIGERIQSRTSYIRIELWWQHLFSFVMFLGTSPSRCPMLHSARDDDSWFY